MPAWINAGYDEYARRLPKELQPRLIELPLALRSRSSNIDKIKKTESDQIIASLKTNTQVILLDVLGKSLSTPDLAKKLEAWQMVGTDVSLIIGGPDGVSSECKAQANELWSLSALTMPHPLVRIVLIEQLYRAWTITQNHPYHKQ